MFFVALRSAFKGQRTRHDAALGRPALET
jgi:hypothetical protein